MRELMYLKKQVEFGIKVQLKPDDGMTTEEKASFKFACERTLVNFFQYQDAYRLGEEGDYRKLRLFKDARNSFHLGPELQVASWLPEAETR